MTSFPFQIRDSTKSIGTHPTDFPIHRLSSLVYLYCNSLYGTSLPSHRSNSKSSKVIITNYQSPISMIYLIPHN